MPRHYIIWLAIFAFTLVGCDVEMGETTSSILASDSGAVKNSGSGQFYHSAAEGGSGPFLYSRDLGSTPQDVYFIFTNTSIANAFTPTTVNSQQAATESLFSRPGDFDPEFASKEENLLEWAQEQGIGLRGTPAITAFNANPPQLVPSDQFDALQRPVGMPDYAVSLGQSANFKIPSDPYDEWGKDIVTATVKKVIDTGDQTLNIWVADDAWEGNCSASYCLNQTMVETFGEKFLKTGSDNDIFDWVTGIFGEHWGTQSYSDLLDAGNSKPIHILFYDIFNDNATDGGYLGFYWSKDNYKASQHSYSNEKLMFYMDSVLTAKPHGDSWEVTDFWPAEMLSTLAHEFQHMINFYQKTVLKSPTRAASETWLNEMASLMAEDFLADKLGVDGPRGVSHADGTAGNSGNVSGRLPGYNCSNYRGVATWYSGNLALASYSLNYAFGAYLARNFGGAGLFRKIVQNEETDVAAIEMAVSEMGYNETFGSLLRKWGVAVLMSDITSNIDGYHYNSGTFFTSVLSGTTYNLGSINLFNYTCSNVAGPAFFNPSSLQALGMHFGTSNTFVKIGEGLTGNFARTIDMPSGVKLTVVYKINN